MHFQQVLLLTLAILLPRQAAAQQDILNLFGGLVRSGIAAATQADWERLSNNEVACIDRTLRERGSSINDLVRQGISPSEPRIAGVRRSCRDQAVSNGPSFDCRKAAYPDEVAICADPELARLDRLIAEGYRSLVEKFGQGPPRSATASLLASRHACRSDLNCIKTVQIATIGDLQQQGARISYAATPTAPESPFVVDGLRLGGQLALGTPAYLEYRCSPSEQYPGFTWCQRRRQENSARGPYVSTNTILHSTDGRALYVNRFLEPAFFAGNEAMDDVRRLSAKFGEPRYVAAPPVAGAPRSLMASWGEVVLEPLDRARLADLAAGREVRAGVLIDHIGNFQRSAAMGLPVYRLSGGPGYVWAANWDQGGRGTLRFLTIDASGMMPPAAQQLAGASAAAPIAQNRLSPEPNESLRNGPAAGSSPAPKIAAPPTPAAPNSSGPDVASSPSGEPPRDVASREPAPSIPNAPARTNAALSGSASPPVGKPSTNSEVSQPVQRTEAPAVVARRESSAPAETNATPAGSPLALNRPDPPTTAAPSPEVKTAQTSNASSSRAPPATQAERAVEKQPEPRVVGPPIALQAVVKEAPPSDSVQWALMAMVIVLLAATGFLLLERRKRTGAAEPKPQSSIGFTTAEPSKEAVLDLANVAMERAEPAPELISLEAPPPIPMESPNSSASSAKLEAGNINVGQVPVSVQSTARLQSSSIMDHKHFGTGLLAALVAFSALMSQAIGIIGLLPLALAIYLLPTIIAFKVRHHYAGWLAVINVVFGATVLGWFGILIWALTGPRKSALDAMGQPSALGLSKSGSTDPALQMSDNELRSGWKMPVVQAEMFSFGDGAPAVESGDGIKVFFKNPVVGIWRTGSSTSNCVRYNALTQIRCVAIVGSEMKLRVGRTLGRTALTGIGAAILTGGRGSGLGAAFLDYRFAGDEKDEFVAALIVFSDYSSVVIQSESEEFEKFCALLPARVLSEEEATKTAEEIDRIKRMAEDGPPVIDEMQQQIAKTKESITTFAAQAKTGASFADRDEGRTGLARAQARLIDESAVLNAVERLIRLAGGFDLTDRRIA